MVSPSGFTLLARWFAAIAPAAPGPVFHDHRRRAGNVLGQHPGDNPREEVVAATGRVGHDNADGPAIIEGPARRGCGRNGRRRGPNSGDRRRSWPWRFPRGEGRGWRGPECWWPEAPACWSAPRLAAASTSDRFRRPPQRARQQATPVWVARAFSTFDTSKGQPLRLAGPDVPWAQNPTSFPCSGMCADCRGLYLPGRRMCQASVVCCDVR